MTVRPPSYTTPLNRSTQTPGSSWVVTGDSVVTTLNCFGSIVDAEGRTVTIVDSNGNVLSEGESEYTITVNTLQSTTA